MEDLEVTRTNLMTLIESKTIDLCKFYKIIRTTPPKCNIIDCGRDMRWIKDKTKSDGFVWRCPSHKGRKVSIRKDSYFEKSRLSLEKLMKLVYYFAYETPVTTTLDFVQIHSEAAVGWYAYIRDAISYWLLLPRNLESIRTLPSKSMKVNFENQSTIEAMQKILTAGYLAFLTDELDMGICSLLRIEQKTLSCRSSKSIVRRGL